MSCHRHEAAVFLHAHGQLGPVQRWFLEAHLQTCPTCRGKWAQWVVERDHLRRAFSPMPGTEPVGAQLLTSVGARIRGERQEQPAVAVPAAPEAPSRTRLAIVAAVAALLALAVAAAAGYWAPTSTYWGGAADNCATNAPASCTLPGNTPAANSPDKKPVMRPTPAVPERAPAVRPAP